MNYEDMVGIGANINAAIERALHAQNIQDPVLVGEIAQAILLQLDQAGYQIVRK